MTRASLLVFGVMLIAAVWSLAGAAWAVRPDEMLANPRLEARAQAIGEELRCLVCQNESIEESNADLAHDLRVLVRQRIQAGDSDAEVKRYIVARYGTFVLLNPPLNAQTWLLWFGPCGLLILAAALAVTFYRQTVRRAVTPAPLSTEERRRLAVLLDDGAKSGKA